jgi:hypothetical protein
MRAPLARALCAMLALGVASGRGRNDPCPADVAGRECSGHGLCRRGRCLCDPGYSGSACEPKREAAPTGGRAGRNRMVDDNGRPRYGRAYADQLKQDLASEMDRRRAENEERMRRLRDQFKDQNKQIEEASSGVKEKLERARVENQAQIEEMQEQREVEVEEITRNTERIKEQVDGVGEGLKEQLQAEYESVAQQAQDLSDKSKEDYVEPFVPPELQNVEEELPYSLDIFLGAAEDMYDVIDISEALDDATLFEDDGWEAYVAATLASRQEGGGSTHAQQFDEHKFEEAKMELETATARMEEEEAGREAVRQEEAAALAEAGLDPDSQEAIDFLQERRGRGGASDISALGGGGGGGGGGGQARPPPPPPPPPRPPPPPPPARTRPPPPATLTKGAAQETYEVIELDDEDDDDFL